MQAARTPASHSPAIFAIGALLIGGAVFILALPSAQNLLAGGCHGGKRRAGEGQRHPLDDAVRRIALSPAEWLEARLFPSPDFDARALACFRVDDLRPAAREPLRRQIRQTISDARRTKEYFWLVDRKTRGETACPAELRFPAPSGFVSPATDYRIGGRLGDHDRRDGRDRSVWRTNARSKFGQPGVNAMRSRPQSFKGALRS
jgi:hypothetical protein